MSKQTSDIVALLLVGTVCGAGGWYVGTQHAEEKGLKRTQSNVTIIRGYCTSKPRDATADDMCTYLLGR